MSDSAGSGVYAQVEVIKKDALILSNLLWYSMGGLLEGLKIKTSKFIKPSDYHSTLLYSRVGNSDEIKAQPEVVYKSTISDVQLWETNDKVLVCLLSCKQLKKRHLDLMRTYNLQWDYKNYIPHITLCYDLNFGPRILQRLKNILVGQTVTLINEKIESLDTEHKDTE
jgi:2'-5' RNA ligase